MPDACYPLQNLADQQLTTTCSEQTSQYFLMHRVEERVCLQPEQQVFKKNCQIRMQERPNNVEVTGENNTVCISFKT